MVKLFTHIDLDGIGCAVLAKLAFKDEINITYCNYDDIDKQVRKFLMRKNNATICNITDISISDDLAEEINRDYKNIFLLDHHPTALELNKYDWCKIEIVNPDSNIKTSGTELYYYWLIENGYLTRSKQIEAFVDVVRDYDTWRWAALGEEGIICKKVHDLYKIYGKESFIPWCLSEINDGVFPRLDNTERWLLNAKQKEIDDYIENKNKTMITLNICDYTCGFVFADKYYSELGNRLCIMHHEIDFVAIINMDGTVSYRTIKDDINLGRDIAKLFGGGGHPMSAGSEFSQEIRLKAIENIFG